MNTKTEVGVLRKAYGFGDGDDFYPRFLMGHGNIRTCAYGREKQSEYDKSFHPIFQNLLEMKMVKDRCISTIKKHVEAIKVGTDGKYHGSQIDVDEPIDDELNLFFKDLFIRGQMAIDGLIKHAGYMGYNISFLFTGDEKKFRNGLKNFALKEDDERFKALVDFVTNHKNAWYISFREMRRQIEHEGWSLPNLKYTLDDQLKVQVHIPKSPNHSIQEIIESHWENITLFCEEVVTFLLSLKLRDNMVIVYIPEDKRDKNMPVRYMVSLKEFPGVPLQCS